MKYLYILLPLAALINAAPTANEPSVESYDLKLVLEGTGEDAVWRLRDEDIPAHVNTTIDTSFDTSNVSPNHSLARRWTVNCFNSNKAEAKQCRILADSIRYSRSPIPNSPRHIVYGGCYISWSKVVKKDQSAFYSGASDTLSACINGSNGGGQPLVSGVARNYLENGVTQCLSNRAKGCTN